MSKKITLCSTTDDKYVRATCVTIHSVCQNNRDCQIIYYVVTDCLSNEGFLLLKGLQKKHRNLSLQLITLDIKHNHTFQSFFEEVKLSLANSHISRSAYIRLLLTELLPIDVERVIYLDSDVLCLGSLVQLQHYFNAMGNFLVAAVLDEENEREKKRLNLVQYVNSGILLINLEGWRKEEVLNKFLVCVQRAGRYLKYHDQDIINLVLNERIFILPKRWNWQLPVIYCSKKSRESVFKNACILHFVSEKKPWYRCGRSSWSYVWQSYYENCFEGHFKYLEADFLITDELKKYTNILFPKGSKIRKLVSFIIHRVRRI